MNTKIRRMFACVCVLALVLSTLPLYAVSFYNHPYYDDYGFSAQVHKAWQETGSLKAVAQAAARSAANTRQTWQGTYTGTILSNIQPGLFDEDLYWIGSFVLLTALIGCMWLFLNTVFAALGVQRLERVSLCALSITLVIQFMPDAGEAFYWFNGGIGNVFIYSLLMLAAALLLRFVQEGGLWRLAPLALLAVALGGGSYGGGLFALCLCAVLLTLLFWKKQARRFHVLGLVGLFAVCFLYSMSAPGNAVRASVIRYESSALKTIVQSFHYGIALLGGYVCLPVIAVTLVLLPAFYEAARRSEWQFSHPWSVLGLGVCLYCTQFAPPLYSIASIGAGRIVNTYWISFVVLWMLYAYYLTGHIARRLEAANLTLPALTGRRFGALVCVALCMLGMGSLAFKRDGDVLYGAQNLSGPSAALSILTGEAAQYDAEMTAREVLLNDESQPVITLKPLSAVPSVFMDDLIMPGAVYDVRPSLCMYYGKTSIAIEGEVDAP